MRELALVRQRARPHRRAPHGDTGRGAGAGAAQVQTPGDGGRRSGGANLRHRQRRGAARKARERNPGERRLGSRAWLRDIPQATGQSVHSPDLYMTRLLNMDAGMMVICQQASPSAAQ